MIVLLAYKQVAKSPKYIGDLNIVVDEDFIVHNLSVKKLTRLVIFLSSNDHSNSISNSQSFPVDGIIR
jgi:hypothetical protein